MRKAFSFELWSVCECARACARVRAHTHPHTLAAIYFLVGSFILKESKVKLPLSLLLKSVWQHRAAVVKLSLYSCLHLVSKIVISTLTMFVFPGNADGCSSTKVNLPSPHQDAFCEQMQQQRHVRDNKRALQSLCTAGFFAKGFLCTRFTPSHNARDRFGLVTTSTNHLYKDTIFPFQFNDGTLVLTAYGRIASHYKDQVLARENYIPDPKFGLSDLQC